MNISFEEERKKVEWQEAEMVKKVMEKSRREGLAQPQATDNWVQRAKGYNSNEEDDYEDENEEVPIMQPSRQAVPSNPQPREPIPASSSAAGAWRPGLSSSYSRPAASGSSSRPAPSPLTYAPTELDDAAARARSRWQQVKLHAAPKPQPPPSAPAPAPGTELASGSGRGRPAAEPLIPASWGSGTPSSSRTSAPGGQPQPLKPVSSVPAAEALTIDFGPFRTSSDYGQAGGQDPAFAP
jgi:hypothetical protein